MARGTSPAAALWYREQEEKSFDTGMTQTIRIRASTPSQRIIAAGIVIAFCYFAASVVMTLLLSMMLAYFLDPVVETMERMRISRAFGSLLVVVFVVALVAGLGYLLIDRAERFAGDWPRYRAVLQDATQAIERRLETVETSVSEITPRQPRLPLNTVRVEGDSAVRSMLLRGLGSLYIVLLGATFIPFLIFFMLAAKRAVWHATMQLFPASERTRVKEALDSVGIVLRSFVVGNVFVALILALLSWGFFWLIGLDYAFLTGVVSGLLNLVPYLGAVLAWIPPVIMGMTHWKTIGPFLGMVAVLSFFHIIAMNVLVPQLVGKRVRLNALAVTVALLFWGWLWGGMGLVLAIPITATLKVICDHIEAWQPVGRWLGA
jgi:predicted PurR-regulated permease PerM